MATFIHVLRNMGLFRFIQVYSCLTLQELFIMQNFIEFLSEICYKCDGFRQFKRLCLYNHLHTTESPWPVFYYLIFYSLRLKLVSD